MEGGGKEIESGLVECIHILVAGWREGCMIGKIDRFEFFCFYLPYTKSLLLEFSPCQEWMSWWIG
jgi:hypothetical protein